MIKVYCKNCNQCKIYSGEGLRYPICDLFNRQIQLSDYSFSFMKAGHVGNPYANINNACRNYTRKWYKFWIKKQEVK